jgi:hypothetical protein
MDSRHCSKAGCKFWSEQTTWILQTPNRKWTEGSLPTLWHVFSLLLSTSNVSMTTGIGPWRLLTQWSSVWFLAPFKYYNWTAYIFLSIAAARTWTGRKALQWLGFSADMSNFLWPTHKINVRKQQFVSSIKSKNDVLLSIYLSNYLTDCHS